MTKIIVAFVIALSGSVFASSETVKGVKKDYEQFKLEMTQELQVIDQKIETLKAKAKTKSSETQDQTIQDLEKTRNELNAKLDEMQKDGKTGWKKFKKNFAESINTLNKKIQKSLEN